MRPFTLLIEDDPRFSEPVSAGFELRGIPLDVAATWEEGLAMFQVCAHELVIADYQLPGDSSGFELLIAAKQHRPGTLLVLISGVLSEGAVTILDGSPLVDAYYAKEPTILDDLLRHVAEAAERAALPADWPRIAANWLNRQHATEEEIADLAERLRAELLRR